MNERYEAWHEKLVVYLRFQYGDAVARYHDTSAAQRWYQLGYTPEGAGDKLIAE